MKSTVMILAATLTVLGALAPGAAMAQSRDARDRQESKNAARSAGIGLGIAALGALSRGDRDGAFALGVGAAIAGKSYEDQRQDQARYDRYDDRRYDSRYDDRRNDRRESRAERLRREEREREIERERAERLRYNRRPYHRDGCDLTGPGGTTRQIDAAACGKPLAPIGARGAFFWGRKESGGADANGNPR